MKIRNGFVTNSSSSSFIVSKHDNEPEIFNYFKDIEHKTTEMLAQKLHISKRDFVRKYGNMSDIINSWNIEITGDSIICSIYLDDLDDLYSLNLKGLALDLGLDIIVDDVYED